jgi:hypothetical protein
LRLRYGNPSRLSGIRSSSKSNIPKTSDKSTNAKGDNIVEVTDVDTVGTVGTVDTLGAVGTSNLSPPATSLMDSIENAEPESRWKKDAVWRNIESPLIPFDLTDDEVHSIGTAAFLSADSCFTDDCIVPVQGMNQVNETSDKRISLNSVLSGRRFGFVSTMALSQSLKILAKGPDREICIVQKIEEYEMKGDQSRPSVVEDFKHSAKSNDHEQALFGVSEMLTVLKQYVKKSRFVIFRTSYFEYFRRNQAQYSTSLYTARLL